MARAVVFVGGCRSSLRMFTRSADLSFDNSRTNSYIRSLDGVSFPCGKRWGIVVFYPISTNPERRYVVFMDENGFTGITIWNANTKKITHNSIGSMCTHHFKSCIIKSVSTLCNILSRQKKPEHKQGICTNRRCVLLLMIMIKIWILCLFLKEAKLWRLKAKRLQHEANRWWQQAKRWRHEGHEAKRLQHEGQKRWWHEAKRWRGCVTRRSGGYASSLRRRSDGDTRV